MEIVKVVTISKSTINVIWIPPAQPNGIITEYEISYSVYGDTDNIMSDTVDSNKNTFIIINLGEMFDVM